MVRRNAQLVWLIVLILPALTIYGQFYKKKPYSEWSEKETQKMLNDSPWAETYTFTQQEFVTPGTNTGGVDETHVSFYIRWLSAKPIRQAIAHLMTVQNTSESARAALKPKLEAFIARSLPEHIVLSINYDSNDGERKGEVMQIMNSLVTSLLKNNTYLVKDNGEKVWIAEYQPPQPDGLGAKFIFPRQLDGKPFLGTNDKEVRLITKLGGRYSLNVRFKVADMMFDGKLEY
jgi:hypothetical protein